MLEIDKAVNPESSEFEGQYPLKCFRCGCDTFEHKNCICDEQGVVEHDFICKSCGADNGHFAYGYWYFEPKEENNV